MSSLGSLPPLGWVKKTKKILRQQTSSYRAMMVNIENLFHGILALLSSLWLSKLHLKNFWLDFLFPKDNLCQPPLWPTELELGDSQTLSTPPFPGIRRLKHSHRSNPHVLISLHPLSYFWSVMVKSCVATKKLRDQNSSRIKSFILCVLTFNPQICYLSLKIASQTAHSSSILVGWLSIEMVSTARCTYEKVNHLCT